MRMEGGKRSHLLPSPPVQCQPQCRPRCQAQCCTARPVNTQTDGDGNTSVFTSITPPTFNFFYVFRLLKIK